MKILNNSEATKQLNFIVGTGGVAKGDLVTLTAGKVVKSATNDTAIIGVAQETAIATATVNVELVENNTVEALYTGTAPTSASIGALVDLDSCTVVDLDASTNGDAMIVGFNVDTQRVNLVFPKANRIL